VDNFDGLPIHDIIAVFLNSWIMGVPFLEVNINVVVRHRLSNGGICGGGCLLPFWKNKFFWLDDDF